MQNINHGDKIVTVQQAADYLSLSTATLNKWRCQGGGPAYIKLGRAVRYRLDDLQLFLEKSRMQ